MNEFALGALLGAIFWWLLFCAHPFPTLCGTFVLAALISRCNER